MRIKNKSATILVYVLFLVTLSLIFATIILNNYAYLSNYTRYADFESKLMSSIKYSSSIAVDIDRELNSNGQGYIDNISCPTNFTMSGSTSSGVISTSLYIGDFNYCEGTYMSNYLKIYFNSGSTDLTSADYNGYLATISGGIGNFLDPDLTNIDFSSTSYLSGDSIDDNLNSDDYKGYSTGTIVYPNAYQDDDDLARKKMFGYVPPDEGTKKVFWSTSGVSKIVEENLNNTGGLNLKIGDITSGFLHFDIDKPYDIKLVEFDKSRYDFSKELVTLNSYTGSSNVGEIGYLQNDMSITSGTGGAFIFDFTNKDYAIFLKSITTDTLLYEITGEDSISGKDIYITPIDDSAADLIRYFGSEILINTEGLYMSKESEVIYKK